MTEDKQGLEIVNQEMGAYDDAGLASALPYAPPHKLDAEQFIADDIDGVTENAAGTGNLNFLMLQGELVSASFEKSSFAAPTSLNEGPEGSVSLNPVSDNASVHDMDDGGVVSRSVATIASPSTEGASDVSQSSMGQVARQSASLRSASSDVSESQSSSNTQSTSNTANGSNGSNGQDGRNGGNGGNGAGEGGDTITNSNNTTTNNTITSTTTNTSTVNNTYQTNHETHYETVNNQTVNSTTNNNTVNTVSNTTTTNNTTNTMTHNEVHNETSNHYELIDLGDVVPVVETVTGPVITIVHDAGDTLTQIVNTVINLGDVTPVLETVIGPVTNIVHEAGDTITEIVNSVVNVLPEVPDIVADIIEHVPQLPVLDGVDDLIGVHLDGNPGADQDIGLLLGDTPIDLTLNGIENLTGDIDLNIGGGIALFDPSGTNNAQGDTDLVIAPDLDLAGIDLLSFSNTITLDPLESFIGDVDLDISGAINVLGHVSDPVLDALAGGNDTPLLDGLTGWGLADLVLEPVIGAGGTGDAADGDVDAAISLGVNGETILDQSVSLLVNPVEDVLGDLDVDLGIHIDLFNPETSTADDNDINLGLDGDVAGQDALNALAGFAIDPLESIVGDIDINAGIAGDILGQMADQLVNGGQGGTGQDSLLANVGSILEDIAQIAVPDLPVFNDPLALIMGSASEPSSGSSLWTESIVGGPSAFVETAVTGGLESIVPDVVGGLSHGLENLGHALGGGGHHHGGGLNLFG